MSKRPKSLRSRISSFRRAGCWFILAMFLAVVALGGILIFAFTNVLDPVGQQGNAFMTALRNEQYDAAYALTSKAFQQQSSVQGFGASMREFTSPPTNWRFTSFSVNGLYGRILGRVTLEGQEYNLTIYFVYEDGRWAVNGFDLTQYKQTDLVPTPAPTATPSQ
jgi:hypothetical protein